MNENRHELESTEKGAPWDRLCRLLGELVQERRAERIANARRARVRTAFVLTAAAIVALTYSIIAVKSLSGMRPEKAHTALVQINGQIGAGVSADVIGPAIGR